MRPWLVQCGLALVTAAVICIGERRAVIADAADISGNRDSGTYSTTGVSYQTRSPVDGATGSGITLNAGQAVSTQPQANADQLLRAAVGQDDVDGRRRAGQVQTEDQSSPPAGG